MAQDAVKEELLRTDGDVKKGQDLAVAWPCNSHWAPHVFIQTVQSLDGFWCYYRDFILQCFQDAMIASYLKNGEDAVDDAALDAAADGAEAGEEEDGEHDPETESWGSSIYT